MDQGPLVNDQIEAGARFLDAFLKTTPILAAFWLKDRDDGEWNLYVASDRISDDNFDVAYGEVLRIAGALADPLFDPFQVKLIGANDPLAQAAVDVRRNLPAPTATRVRGKVFGGTPVDEVYVYPSRLPLPA